MNILCTGSRGFIGTALVKELEEAGHRVKGFDHNNSPLQDVLRPDALDLMLEFTPGDPQGFFDVVVHLAAEVGKLNCEINPSQAIVTNVTGTLNVARACAKHNVPLVYCSTSEVYGDHGGEWVDEETESMWPPDVYGLTKYWGEQVCRSYAPDGLKIVRPVMAYGPGVPPGPGRRALDNFIWWALMDQPIVVHRGAARTWCWVDDIASAIRVVIEKGDPGVYNVGRDDDEVQMTALANMIVSYITESSYDKIEVVDPPARQTAVKRISCAKLCALGWEPKVSLDEGLPKMVAWIRAWMDGPCESCDQLPPDLPFPMCKCYE